jgi:hypothetical protein
MCCICWFAILIFALDHGNLQKLTAPIDAARKFCGVSPGYEGYDYLLVQPDLNDLDSKYRDWF